MQFSDILKDLREERAFTQKEVAKACKVSSQCISSLEQGTRNPTGSTIISLSKFFEVSTDYLLGIEEYYATAPAMGEGERELLRLFRALPPEYQELALTNLRTWTGEGRQSQKKKA